MFANSLIRRALFANACQVSALTGTLPGLARGQFFSTTLTPQNRKSPTTTSIFNSKEHSGLLNQGISLTGLQIQCRNYPARKGTREKRERLKKKRKKEQIVAPKLTFLQRQKLKKEAQTVYVKQRPKESQNLGQPIDDVFFFKKYDTYEWAFADAVQNHRELHHPTMYNRPNCPLLLRIHMNFLVPGRVTKSVDGWRSVVEMKMPFLLPGMVVPTVLAICPNDPTEIEEAIEAGADSAGGSELIKSIQTGIVNPSEFEYILCHPLMITELTAVRGLMKKKFPNVRSKTLDVDIPGMVRQFKAGMKVHALTSPHEPGYGWVEAPIGTLDMDTDGMERNFESILSDTLAHRLPQRTADTFILSCVLQTAYSFEKFTLNSKPYILKLDKRPAVQPKATTEEASAEEESEESEEKVAAKKSQG